MVSDLGSQTQIITKSRKKGQMENVISFPVDYKVYTLYINIGFILCPLYIDSRWEGYLSQRWNGLFLAFIRTYTTQNETTLPQFTR